MGQYSTNGKGFGVKERTWWREASWCGLAARFKGLIGDTPMNYLTNWRVLKAKEILRSEHLPLAEVAERVGYKSEATFSLAFKRECYQSPSSYRRANERSR